MSAPVRPTIEEGGPLEVQPGFAIPRAELTFRATKSGGPGGQHVNTSSTRIELTWNVARSTAIDEARRDLLRARLATRLDGEGTIRIVSTEMRSQLQNRIRAEERLVELLRKALVVPKRRKATKVSRGQKEKRLDEKKQNSDRKKNRQAKWD